METSQYTGRSIVFYRFFDVRIKIKLPYLFVDVIVRQSILLVLLFEILDKHIVSCAPVLRGERKMLRGDCSYVLILIEILELGHTIISFRIEKSNRHTAQHLT